MTSPPGSNRGNTVSPDDPFGEIKSERKDPSPPPIEVNLFHKRSDIDSGPFSQHHTLGVKHNQASPGDHIHDGKSSRKLGEGLGLSISGTKGSAASEDSIVTMLANFITFTDNRTP